MKRINLYIIASFAIFYIGFLCWYYKPAKSFSPNEIASYITSLQSNTDGMGRVSENELNKMVRFMKNDDGKPFYNINIIKYRKQALYPSDNDLGGTGKEANARYSDFMMKEVLSRASHPITVLMPTIRLMGDEIGNCQPYWDNVSIIRYRSRRDFMDVITSEGFKNGNVHKWAGVEDTLVYPAQGYSLSFPAILMAETILLIMGLFYVLAFFLQKIRLT